MDAKIADPSNAGPRSARASRPARCAVWLAAVVLAYLVCALFLPIVSFEFVNLDVPQQVIENPHIRGLTSENVRHILSTWCIASYYPVRTLTYAVDYQLRGLDPGGFKRTNGLIHVGNVLLVFWLILRLFRHPMAVDGSAGPWWDVAVAAIPAGIFAVHPVVVEPVAWVPGREELLMTLGALGCIHFFLTARRLGEVGGRRRAAVASHVLATLCCVLACLSNAVAAVIPLLITAWDLLTLEGRKLKRILCGTSFLWMVGAATILIKKAGDSLHPRPAPMEMFSIQQPMVVLHVYWLNLKTLVWPKNLTVDYPRVKPQSFLDQGVVLGVIAVGLTCAVLWSVRRRRLAFFGLAWFGLALAPTSQIMPHHIDRADRFLYLPLVGLAVAAAMLLRPLNGAVKKRAAVTVVGVLGLTVPLLHVVSARHLPVWRDGVTLWENCLRLDPYNAFAHSCLADNLSEKEQFDRAIPHYERALELGADDYRTLHNFAMRLAVSHKEEWRDYERAIRLARRGCEVTEWKDPKLRRALATAHMNFATALKQDGRVEEAIHQYREAIEADPTYEVAMFNLAILLVTRGDEELRRPDEAFRLIEQARAVVGEFDALQLRIIGDVYAEAGQFDKAIAVLEEAIFLTEAVGMTQWTDELRKRLELCRKGVSPLSRDN